MKERTQVGFHVQSLQITATLEGFLARLNCLDRQCDDISTKWAGVLLAT